MKITSIRSTGTNKYNLIIDGQKYSIYDAVIIKYNLLKCKEISNDIFLLVKEDNLYYELYYKIIKYISFKMRTERETYLKLITLGATKKVALNIINQLKQEKYLDDDKYLELYIKEQLNLTLNGPKKIANSLIKNGFTEDSITNELEKIEPEIWLKRVKKLIEKKVETIKGSKITIMGKLKIYLNGLGYYDNQYKDLINNIKVDDFESLKKDYKKYYLKLSRKYTEQDLQFRLKQKLYSLGYSIDDIDRVKEN